MSFNQPDIEEHFIETQPFIRCLLSLRQLFYTGRGHFYPDKNFGSQLAVLPQPATAYALAFAAQAVAESDGVDVVGAEQQGRTVTLTLRINDEEGRVNYQTDEIL